MEGKGEPQQSLGSQKYLVLASAVACLEVVVIPTESQKASLVILIFTSCSQEHAGASSSGPHDPGAMQTEAGLSDNSPGMQSITFGSITTPISQAPGSLPPWQMNGVCAHAGEHTTFSCLITASPGFTSASAQSACWSCKRSGTDRTLSVHTGSVSLAMLQRQQALAFAACSRCHVARDLGMCPCLTFTCTLA